MASQTWLLLLIFLTTVIAEIEDSIRQLNLTSCEQNLNSKAYSRDDLSSLLSSLSSNINDTGFLSATHGGANAIALCRADIQLDTCRSCVKNVAEDLLQKCPNHFRGIMCINRCMVRYSNQPIFGKLANEPYANNSSPQAFNAQQPMIDLRETLIEDLRFKAAAGGDLRKAAAGNKTAPDGETVIYAMVQCTPDLSSEDCASCTADIVRRLSDYRLPWIIFYKPSCTLRFDTVPFYNLTRLQELPLQSPTGHEVSGGHTTRNIIIIVISIVVFLLVASFVGLFAIKRIKQKKMREYIHFNPKNDDQIISIESIQHDFVKIRAATNDFADANKLGEGGFGTVYKGNLENDLEIAVKRLSKNSCQGDLEFKNEVLLLAKLQHRNLVRLLGFSTQGNERLLIYGFVQNGSLDRFIFDRVESSNLDWGMRYKIIVGISKGLVYLHEDSNSTIIHRDLKAGNVLLDKDMIPKISDFGLAKLLVPDIPDVERHITSTIVGTSGYMAPEYKSKGHYSVKSDVYSFGIMVLEIVTGQRNEDNSGDLISRIWRCWREDTSEKMIDSVLKAKSDDHQPDMLRCIHIGLLCIQEDPEKRPTMDKVGMMLSNSSLTLPLPNEPGFYNLSYFTKDSGPPDK